MRSPGHPTYPFVPRSQIKHSYGLAISSARDNLDCRWIETIFITILVRNAIGNTRACRVETFSTLACNLYEFRGKHRDEWGGPPGPRPTPSSACSVREEPDLVDKRVGPGDPRGPGGPPHDLCADVRKWKKYVALGQGPAPQ